MESAEFILIFALFPVFFALLWLFVSFVIAAVGGWSRLAGTYRASSEFRGQKWSFRSGRMGWLANYRSVLTVGANQEGLFLAVFPLYRAGHPNLFIPWYDITITERKGLVFPYQDFTFARVPSVRLRLPRKTGELLAAARSEVA